ncbi:MAG: PEP-CTERM sorting domain-containing protein, partial [Deltaproteobacteria bacterium]|nr:PEP-CTERM sorting domain-containing protein [Deltaproteobacteria bacterium]
NAACCGPLAGIGLPAGNTAYLGTVTFHKDALVNGTFNIDVGVDGPIGTDDIASLNPQVVISDTVTFNGASLINVPEPGALSLLVMGLGGMLLAGRGRRS